MLIVFQAKSGRIYYHNASTGQDCWEKPSDFEELASKEPPMMNIPDGVRDAMLAEHAVLEGKKIGIPEATMRSLQLQASAKAKQDASSLARFPDVPDVSDVAESAALSSLASGDTVDASEQRLTDERSHRASGVPSEVAPPSLPTALERVPLTDESCASEETPRRSSCAVS